MRRGRREEWAEFQVSQEGVEGNLNKKEGGRGKRIIFWNIAGIGRQGKDFWNFVKEYDFISLSETWLEEQG